MNKKKLCKRKRDIEKLIHIFLKLGFMILDHDANVIHFFVTEKIYKNLALNYIINFLHSPIIIFFYILASFK